jgi:hypothetical protein
MEQVVRALSVVGRRWLGRRCGVPDVAHMAGVIRYQQRCNAAAIRSRNRSAERRE